MTPGKIKNGLKILDQRGLQRDTGAYLKRRVAVRVQKRVPQIGLQRPQSIEQFEQRETDIRDRLEQGIES